MEPTRLTLHVRFVRLGHSAAVAVEYLVLLAPHRLPLVLPLLLRALPAQQVLTLQRDRYAYLVLEGRLLLALALQMNA